MTNKEIIAKLESDLEQLREWGQECLKNDPNHPRNKFKYTIGCSGAPDDLYTHSLKKAKILCLEMCEKYGCLASVVDDLNIDTVEAFLENFDIADVSSCSDAFQGVYESGAEFAQQLAEDCGDVPRGMSSWIEIDWKASWDNLDYDYVECSAGHIFSQNF